VKFRKIVGHAFCVGVFSLVASSLTFATSLTATGGLSFGRGSGLNEIKTPSPIFGAEYTLNPNPTLDLGLFYDHTFLTYLYGGSGALDFLGVIARAHLRHTFLHGLFADTKMGLTKLSDDNNNDQANTNATFGIGTGVGYEIQLSSHLSLDPRIGVRFLPDPSTQSRALHAMPDASLMIGFRF
jgi:hypothetical protein